MACQFYYPGYCVSTMKAVQDFVGQDSFVDVKLVCKNKKTVYSHKLILASASPFLKAVIEGLNSNDDVATVFLPDFDCNIVSLLLTFLSEGMMKLTWEELQEFRELCNALLLGPFPGAEVVKVSKDSPFSGTEQKADIASRNDLHTPAEVPDTTDTDYAVASIVPKIEECEECQKLETNQPVSGNDFQNTSQTCNFHTTQQTLTDSDFSQLEKHKQKSLEAVESVTYSDATGNVGSWKKVKHSHDDTSTNLNLWHGKSNSTQELSQNNDYYFTHQKSTCQVVHLNRTPTSLTLSTSQSVHQWVQEQSTAKMKNLHTGASVNNKHLIQLLNRPVPGTSRTNRCNFLQKEATTTIE